MKINFTHRLKGRIPFFLGILLFVIVFAIVEILFQFRTSYLLENMAKTNTSGHARNMSSYVKGKFDIQFGLLEKAIIRFENGRTTIKDIFEEDNESIKFGILQLDGTAVCGEELSFSDYPGIKIAFHGNESICSGKDNDLLFTSPIYNNDGNVKYVMYKLFSHSLAEKEFLPECYSGRGSVLIINSTNNIIVSDGKWDITPEMDSDYGKALSQVYEHMHTASSFSAIYNNNSEHYILFASEIPNTGFYIIGNVDEKVAFSEISEIHFLFLWVFGLILILFVVVMIYLMSAEIKVRDRNELREAKQIAENANKAKSDFLANMSHEIRTPINAVLGFDTMILRESNEQHIREYAVAIERAGSTLLSLINDILDLSKIESGKMELVLTKYDFSVLISDVINMIRAKAEQKNLKVELELDKNLPSILYGDDVRIRQILLNIMNNAVKYTDKGGITLCINGEAENDIIHLHFAVRDTGIGIKDADLGKLFAKFERIEDSEHHSVEGTGLGMSITVKLLSLMESKLNVESVYGEGSVFYFDLDQKIIENEKIGSMKKLSGNAEHKKYDVSFIAPDAKILVVDDNSINLKVFVSLLKQTKVIIDEADGGKPALEKILTKKYDIIFLDHMMPDMNGIEVLKQLNEASDYPNKDTPKIALTANVISGAREEYLAAGFHDYLPKPISPEKLEKMISELIPAELKKAPVYEEVTAKKEKIGFPDVEGVDWDYSMLKLKDTELVNSVVNDFYSLAQSDIKELDSMYEKIMQSEGDEEKADALKSYRIKVHSMKTTAAMFGALNVSAMAKILEYAARNSKVERICSLMEIFKEEWLKLYNNIKEAFSFEDEKTADEDKKAIDTSLLMQYLDMLSAAMAELDVDTADSIITELQGCLFSKTENQILEKIVLAVRKLDIKAAQSEIEKWEKLI